MTNRNLNWLAGLVFILTIPGASADTGGALDFGSYEWNLINGEARWTPRAGLQVVNLKNRFYLMGGRTPRPPGFPPVPGESDIWGDVGKDGADWTQVSEAPWNAAMPEEIKYDFAALAVTGGRGGQRPSIYTFGGDRETFDFTDPDKYLNVDNDVWQFAPPHWLSLP